MGRRGLHSDGSRVPDGRSRQESACFVLPPPVHADLPCIGRADAHGRDAAELRLFVCGLSRRALAHGRGLARLAHLFGKSIYIQSGVEGRARPFSVKVMEEVGLDIGRRDYTSGSRGRQFRPDHHAGAEAHLEPSTRWTLSPPTSNGRPPDPQLASAHAVKMWRPIAPFAFELRSASAPGSTGNLRDRRDDRQIPSHAASRCSAHSSPRPTPADGAVGTIVLVRRRSRRATPAS